MQFTHEMIEDLIRCANDIEYFAERHIKVIHVINGIIPLKLNDFQKQAIRDYEEKNSFANMCSRQQGKTTIAAVILLHQALFKTYNTSVIFAPNMRMSDSILQTILDMYHHLPEYIQVEITTKNKSKLEFATNSSIYSCGSNSESNRGRNITNAYIDECEFVDNLHRIVENLYPAMVSTSLHRLFAFTSTRTSEVFKVA